MPAPEELLERIIALAIHSHTGSFPRPSWHVRPPAKCSASILLVNKTFLRIATPLLYRTLPLRSPTHLSLLLTNAFRPNPVLATHVRTIVISGGAFDGLDELVHFCQRVEEFDITLDSLPWEEDTMSRFSRALPAMSGIKHLVLRKDAYLSQKKPKYIISQLSRAIPYWSSLETVNIKFRFSSDPTTSLFVSALSKAPKLKTFRALLPAIWNTTLLTISQNPNLERIHLSPDNELIGSHLFLTEARKYGKLMDLIKAGTPIMRTRAHSSPPATAPSLPIQVKLGAPVYPPPPAPLVMSQSISPSRSRIHR